MHCRQSSDSQSLREFGKTRLKKWHLLGNSVRDDVACGFRITNEGCAHLRPAVDQYIHVAVMCEAGHRLSECANTFVALRVVLAELFQDNGRRLVSIKYLFEALHTLFAAVLLGVDNSPRHWSLWAFKEDPAETVRRRMDGKQEPRDI